MQLPEPVKRSIEAQAERAGFSAVARAAAAISDAYRAGDWAAVARLPAAERVAAYLVTRMPATYAAAFHVLREVRARLEGRPVTSVLDVGAGAGAASLASRYWFPEAAITMIERDRAMAAAAREWLPGTDIRVEDVASMRALPRCDLTIADYSLGEMDDRVAERMWEATGVALAAIEPGAPRAHAMLLRVRDRLLAAGGHMIAPCPGPTPCPLGAADWCHFAARVERTSLHRRVKGGALSYEDEKFSYIALAREPVVPAAGRIIRRTRQEPGKVALDVCAHGEARLIEIRKRDDLYRAARKSEWGGEWPPAA